MVTAGTSHMKRHVFLKVFILHTVRSKEKFHFIKKNPFYKKKFHFIKKNWGGGRFGFPFSVLSAISHILTTLNISFIFLPCSYLFHYICEDRIIYLCITDDVSRFFSETCMYNIFLIFINFTIITIEGSDNRILNKVLNYLSPT